LQKYEIIATSTFGMEALVKNEIDKLGLPITEVKNGRITFEGTLRDVARANIWLRTAERVLLKVGDFEARDFDDLYEKTKKLPWPKLMPINAEFPVKGKSIKSKLDSVPACQSVVKKAIVDSMSAEYGKEWFPEDGSLYQVEIALYKDRALLTIDTSGAGLHKRGYRQLSNRAPIQETIAAGMVYLSKWNPNRVLVDPFAGSGTILIEAAMIAKNMAPGLKRSFVSEDWQLIDAKIWQEVRKEAEAKINQQVEPRLIIGYDRESDLASMGRYHAKQADVDDIIHFQTKDFADFSSNRKYGYIITNPPYGERLDSKEEVEELYKMMGKKLLPLSTWSFYIITSHPNFEQLFGKEASKRRKLFNGGIECHYYQYYGPWPPRNN